MVSAKKEWRLLTGASGALRTVVKKGGEKQSGADRFEMLLLVWHIHMTCREKNRSSGSGFVCVRMVGGGSFISTKKDSATTLRVVF